MALVLNDRVLETSTSTGTGTFALLGASSGFQSFTAAGIANNQTYYAIVNQASGEFETGFGSVNLAGNVLTRTTVFASSNSNTSVNFGAGTKLVFCTYPASKSVYEDATSSDRVSVPGELLAAGNITSSAGGFSAAAASTFNGTVTVTSATNSPFSVNNGITGTPFANSVASFFSNVNAFSQINFENANSGNLASTDLVLTADNGTDTTFFVNLGINSSTYNEGTFTIAGANDGYAYVQDGNFAIGTGTAAKNIKFFQGGTLAANEVARFSPTTNNLLVGTTSDGAGTSKIRAAGIIESTTGGFKFPDGTTQITAAASSTAIVKIGSAPIQSGTFYFLQSGVTTASNINAILGGRSTNSLMDIGAITGGSGYGSATYFNVPLTGGSGSGAVASTIVVSGGAVSSVSLYHNIGAFSTGSITNGGSSYVDGTYNNVPLTGGSGINAFANITVSGGAVTAVSIVSTGTGVGYTAGDTLSASNSFLGGAGSGFVFTVATVSTTFGNGYAYGDTLSASNANLGGTGSGFSVPVTLISGGGDELEMDGIKVSANCPASGIAAVYLDASPGYIAGGRTISYTLS